MGEGMGGRCKNYEVIRCLALAGGCFPLYLDAYAGDSGEHFTLHDVADNDVTVLSCGEPQSIQRECVLQVADACSRDVTVGGGQLAAECVAAHHFRLFPVLFDPEVERLVRETARCAEVDTEGVVPVALKAVDDEHDSVEGFPSVGRDGALGVDGNPFLAGCD